MMKIYFVKLLIKNIKQKQLMSFFTSQRQIIHNNNLFKAPEYPFGNRSESPKEGRLEDYKLKNSYESNN